MAAAQVSRRFGRHGRRPRCAREGVVTDNGGADPRRRGPGHRRPGRARNARSTSGPAWSASASSRGGARASACWARPRASALLASDTSGERGLALEKRVTCGARTLCVRQQEGRPVAKPNYLFEKRQRETRREKERKEEKSRIQARHREQWRRARWHSGRRNESGARRSASHGAFRRLRGKRRGRSPRSDPPIRAARKPSRIDRIEQVRLSGAGAPPMAAASTCAPSVDQAIPREPSAVGHEEPGSAPDASVIGRAGARASATKRSARRVPSADSGTAPTRGRRSTIE